MADEFNVSLGNYNAAVNMIGEIEGEPVPSAEKVATISINEILENRIEVGQLDYEKAAALVLFAEGAGGFITTPQALKPITPVIGPRKGAVSPEVVDAAKEIKAIVGGAGKEYEKNVSKEAQKVKKGELVLPTLSLQDQISELEKISMGVDERVFDHEQIQIIDYELEGLSESIKGENRESSDAFQRNLMTIRDQRLTEARAKAGL